MNKILAGVGLSFFCFIAFTLVVPCTGWAGQTELTPVGEEYLVLVALESLEADFQAASHIVRVKGRFRNVSKSVLRGYITLHILSKNGNVLYTAEMAVNDHRPFGEGESVSFDTVLNVANISGASQVSIDFTRN